MPRVNPQQVPAGGVKLLYTAQPGPQEELMQSTAEEVLYGGAAGGGKSYGLRMFLVNYCLQYPNARVVLFRRTFRELEDTHISMLQQELPSFVATYSVGKHEFTFKNGSVLMLRFCEHEEDVYSYDTFEADAMAFDELTAFSEFQYVYLMTRCRSTKAWWPGRRIRSATNPGNVGHVWVKRRFIDFTAPYEVKKGADEEGGLTREFIPAKVADNPALARRDPDYIKMLRALPDEIYRAKALGDWSVFSGQFFGKWRPFIHEVNPFEIPHDWQRYICTDWGLAVPHATYWAARPPSTNTLYVYREQYGAGVPTAEQARQAKLATIAAGEKIEFVVTDPAMWAKGKDAEGNEMLSVADYWKREFAGICDVVKGNNERLQGASLFREKLDWTGVETETETRVLTQPQLYFMRSCPNAIRTIPALVHSSLNPEDVDTNGEDHSYDAIRYLLRALFAATPLPKPRRYVLDQRGAVVVVAA